MKTFLKIVGGLVGLVVLLVIGLVATVVLTLKPNLPGEEFALQEPETRGVMNVLVFGATGKLGLEIANTFGAHTPAVKGCDGSTERAQSNVACKRGKVGLVRTKCRQARAIASGVRFQFGIDATGRNAFPGSL